MKELEEDEPTPTERNEAHAYKVMSSIRGNEGNKQVFALVLVFYALRLIVQDHGFDRISSSVKDSELSLS